MSVPIDGTKAPGCGPSGGVWGSNARPIGGHFLWLEMFSGGDVKTTTARSLAATAVGCSAALLVVLARTAGRAVALPLLPAMMLAAAAARQTARANKRQPNGNENRYNQRSGGEAQPLNRPKFHIKQKLTMVGRVGLEPTTKGL